MMEAAVMSCVATRRQEILVARSVHPNYRAVLNTYAKDFGFTVREIPFVDGVTSLEELTKLLSKSTAAVVIQNPNFLGSLEDLQALIEAAHSVGALFTAVCNPTALAILAAPGTLGADIVVGDGQPLGLPVAFGGDSRQARLCRCS